jgi:plasmid stabilization system protein ParE
MMRYRFLDQAILELEDAVHHYAAISEKLSLKLRDEGDRALAYLCEFPHAVKPIGRIYRSYKLHRFPYVLVYRIAGAELIIVAVAHTSRKPGYWLRPIVAS